MTNTPHYDGKIEVGYLQWKHLIVQGLLASLTVVFYTTEQSFILSFTKPVHFFLFLATFLKMIVLAAVCGLVSKLLDHYIPWHQNVPYRRFWQIGLGVVALSMVTLQIVYLLYEIVLGINLRHTEYFSRDFTVVMACIVCINFHHYNIYLLSFIKKSREGSTEKGLPMPNKALEDELYTAFTVLETDQNVPATRIAAFYLQEMGNKPKIVRLVRWDGSELTLLEPGSLMGIRERCPFLFLQISRDYLVNRYALSGLRMVGERKYEVDLDIPGTDPQPISKNRYEQLQALTNTGVIL